MDEFPMDPNDPTGKKRVKAIYLNCIAASISNHCQPYFKKFKKPRDVLAHQIAGEIVAEFLLSHYMDNAARTLDAETGGIICQNHDQQWCARRLGLNPRYAIIPQVVQAICPQDHPSRANSIDNENDQLSTSRKHIHVRVKKDQDGNIIEDPQEVLKMPNAINRIKKSEQPEIRVVGTQDLTTILATSPSESKHRRHHHSRSRHHHHHHHNDDEEPEFTRLGYREPPASPAEGRYGLTDEKRKSYNRHNSSKRQNYSVSGGSSRFAAERPKERPVQQQAYVKEEPVIKQRGGNIPKIITEDVTNDIDATWEELENPPNEAPIRPTKCVFQDRVQKLLANDPDLVSSLGVGSVIGSPARPQQQPQQVVQRNLPRHSNSSDRLPKPTIAQPKLIEEDEDLAPTADNQEQTTEDVPTVEMPERAPRMAPIMAPPAAKSSGHSSRASSVSKPSKHSTASQSHHSTHSTHQSSANKDSGSEEESSGSEEESYSSEEEEDAKSKSNKPSTASASKTSTATKSDSSYEEEDEEEEEEEEEEEYYSSDNE